MALTDVMIEEAQKRLAGQVNASTQGMVDFTLRSSLFNHTGMQQQQTAWEAEVARRNSEAQRLVTIDHRDQLIASLMHQHKLSLEIIERLTKAEEAKGDPLVEQVDNVIKGVIGGKVHPKQVDALHNATTRAKQDGAVIRNINR